MVAKFFIPIYSWNFFSRKKKNGVESEQCLLVLTLAILFAFWRDCWSLYFIFVGLFFKMERKMALENLLKMFESGY